YVALKTYAGDHNGTYPAVAGAATSEAPLSLLVPQYTAVTEIFICPGSGHRKLPEAKPFADRKISYAYVMGHRSGEGEGEHASQLLMADALAGTRADAAGGRLFSPDGKAPGNNHHRFGGNLLFGDGQIQDGAGATAKVLSAPAGVTVLNPK